MTERPGQKLQQNLAVSKIDNGNGTKEAESTALERKKSEKENLWLPDKQTIKAFHDKLYADYKAYLSGDKPLLFKMKEVWVYMIHVFPEHEKYWKKIKKASRLCDYEEAVRSMFRELEIQ